MRKKSDFIGVDLFSGAGGMTAGAKMAGIDVQFAVENDKYSAETYSFNNPEVTLFADDIRKLDSIKVKRKGKQLVVFGGPPCQGFSHSNKRSRNKENPNNWLYKEFFRIVKMFKPLPEWIVFENVKGFSDTESGDFLSKVISLLEDLNYSVSHSILNASDFGVPQKRNRFFIVASSKGICFDFLKIKKHPLVVVKDAIDDLPRLEPGNNRCKMTYRKEIHSEYCKQMRNGVGYCHNNLVTNNGKLVLQRYKYIAQGKNWESIPQRLMKNYTDRTRCHSGIYYRLKNSHPSIVIGNFRKNMLIHPTQDRGLSVREAARLQSFQDDYFFKGTLGFQQQQVGNAVPPLLASNIFKKIRKL